MSADQPLLDQEEVKLQTINEMKSSNEHYTNLNTFQPSINSETPILSAANYEYIPQREDYRFGISSNSHIKILNGLLGRDFGKSLFCMALFVSIGLILYLFTSVFHFITVFGVIGLIIGCFMDKSKPKSIFKPIGSYKKCTPKDLDNLWNIYDDNKINEEYALYYKTDFYDFSITKLIHKQNGSNRVYLKRNNPNTLIVEKRHFKNWINYLGFEVGAGFGITISWIVYFLLLYLRVSAYLFVGETSIFHGSFNWEAYTAKFKYMFDVNYLILCFIMSIICGILFALIESIMRRWNYIFPESDTVTVSYFIPLHRINGAVIKTVGHEAINFWQIQNLFIYVFKIYCVGFAFFLYGIPKFIYFVLTRNVALFSWILVTICTVFLFKIKIDHNADYLAECMLIIILTTILCIFCVWFIMPWNKQRIYKCIRCCKCRTLQYDRINRKTQMCLFYVFLLLLVLLFVSMALITNVTLKINKNSNADLFRNDNGNNTMSDSWKTSTTTWDKFVCEQERGTRYVFAQSEGMDISTDTNISRSDEDMNEQLCTNDEIYQRLTVALLILCIVWYILLVTTFIWYNKDKYVLEWTGKRAEFKQIEYSYIYLYVKPQGFLSKSLSGFYDFEYYRIELTTEQSEAFMDYLNQNVPFFKQQKPLDETVEKLHEWIKEET